jgi:hypothetical protein
MNEYTTFVTDSLIEYDKNNRELKNILKNVSYFDYIKIDNDIENDKLIFYDENDNIILEAEFEAISLFNTKYNLWIWGWGNPGWKKKWTKIISQILKYGFTLDPDKNYHLKLELVNSRFTISDPIQIDIHLAIASALSKIPFIYPFIIPEEKEKSKFGLFPQKQRFNIFTDYKEDHKILYLFLFNLKFPQTKN